MTMLLKSQKPICPPKPPDLAQRVRSLMSLADHEEQEFTHGQTTDEPLSMSFLPSHENPCETNKPQTMSKTLNGSFDDLDIPYIDEDDDEA